MFTPGLSILLIATSIGTVRKYFGLFSNIKLIHYNENCLLILFLLLDCFVSFLLNAVKICQKVSKQVI